MSESRKKGGGSSKSGSAPASNKGQSGGARKPVKLSDGRSNNATRVTSEQAPPSRPKK